MTWPFRFRLWRIAIGDKRIVGAGEVLESGAVWRPTRFGLWWREGAPYSPSAVSRWARLRIAARVADFRYGRDAEHCGVLAAAEALYALNHHAKAVSPYGWREYERVEAYQLKTRLLAELYRRIQGRVSLAVQILYCYSCDGTGLWRGRDWCRKCGSSGVHRKVELLTFRFDIGGRVFTWHQPRSLMSWVVPVDEAQPEEYSENRPKYRGELTQLEYEIAAETVARYVDAQGLNFKIRCRGTPVSLAESIGIDYRRWRSNLGMKWRWHRESIRRSIDALAIRLGVRPAQEDHDLPF